MEKIKLSNGILMESVESPNKSYVSSFLVFEIINGELKLVQNIENDKLKAFTHRFKAEDWIKEFGDINKTYTVQECFQRWEKLR